MKKGILILIVFFSLIITSCMKKETINLSLDLENLLLTVDSENFDAQLIVLEDGYLIEVVLPSNNKTYDLYVNNKKIASKEITIADNKLSYYFLGLDYLDGNRYVDLKVNFITAVGYYSKEFLTMFYEDLEVEVKEINDAYTEEITVFKKGRTGLKFHYKLFLKYDSKLDIYIPVYTDLGTKLIEEITNIDYDYIITSYRNDEVENSSLINLFKNDVLKKLITTNKKLYENENVTMKVFDKTNLSITVSYDENFRLPKLTVDDYLFKGWSLNNEKILSIPIYQVKDNVREIDLYPIFENFLIDDFVAMIDNLIPSYVDDNLNFITNFGDYRVVYESSNEEILSNEGKFTIPYVEEDVLLNAKIYDENDFIIEKTYTIKTLFKKDLTVPIASSYIYNGYSSVDSFFFKTLDIINTAFLLADSKGDLSGLSTLKNITSYIFPHTKKEGNWVLFSVGPSSKWSSFARSSEARTNFAVNIVNIINEYGFDGVDIDWETPTVGEEAHYVNLMKTVYKKVKENNPNHLVTTAIAGGPYQPPRYNLPLSKDYIDYINVMTYDMIQNGGGYQNALYSRSTYHNNEYKVGMASNKTSIHDSVKIYNDYGVENEKLIFGIAFYARGQERKKSNDVWSSWKEVKAYNYSFIQGIRYNSNYQYFFDEESGVPYIVKKDGTEYYSFDDERSILLKSAYIKEHNLGGLMFWEYGHDTSNTLLGAMKAGLDK